MLQAKLEFRQILNLPSQNWNSNFVQAKLEYYFNKPQNLKKYYQLEHETVTDDCEGEGGCGQRCEDLNEGEEKSR